MYNTVTLSNRPICVISFSTERDTEQTVISAVTESNRRLKQREKLDSIIHVSVEDKTVLSYIINTLLYSI